MNTNLVYEPITKQAARKLFDTGSTIYVLPRNINPYNIWVAPYEINKTSIPDLDKFINMYIYYNCNAETGNSVKYYKVI